MSVRPHARLLACGLCYEENGEEVHPHPECTRIGGVSMLNEGGRWVPSIPLPFFGIFTKGCGACGRKFLTTAGYRGHYAAAHTVNPEVG